jgi:hypothetical protein
MEWGAVTFGDWCPTRLIQDLMVTSRSYGYFPHSLYIVFGKNGLSNNVQNCLVLSKKPEEIVGG